MGGVCSFLGFTTRGSSGDFIADGEFGEPKGVKGSLEHWRFEDIVDEI